MMVASRQDRLYNLRGPMHNENVGPSVQKLLRMSKCEALLSMGSMSGDLCDRSHTPVKPALLRGSQKAEQPM